MTQPHRFNAADPTTFPLEFKSWVVNYVQQELLITQLTGYRAATAPNALLSSYRVLTQRSSAADAQTATTDAIMLAGSPSLATLPAGAVAAGGVFYATPADYALSGLTQYMAVRAALMTNATAPGQTFVVNLYPVTAFAGGAAANTITLGTAVATLTFTTPALNTITTQDSGDFVFPAAGPYVLAVTFAGNMAANSAVTISASVRARTI